MKKSSIKKAQAGKSVKPTADSTDYFKSKSERDFKHAKTAAEYGARNISDEYMKKSSKAALDASRQKLKGKSGFDENGFPIYKNKFKPESPKQQIEKGMKKKMQAGGVVKSQPRRVGPVDPNGAYTKVQERTLAGKKAAAPKLTKDKELGATKMKKGGKVSKKK